MTSYLVVGAGSSGTVIAARLSEHPEHDVTLIEAGPDHVPAAPGVDFLATLKQPGLTFDDLEATRVAGTPPKRYLAGRGVGGSSLVNGMIGIEGGPFRHAHEIPTELVDPSAWGSVCSALVASTQAAAPVPLTIRDGSRVSVAHAYLAPARGRGNLHIVADTMVRRLILQDRRVVGVVTASGEEFFADRTVVSAGAMHTPALLLRSGIDTPGIGVGLKDHPSASVTLELHTEAVATAGSFAVTTALRAGDVQVLPMNHLGTDAPRLGLLMPALMRVRSEGRVSLAADPDASPTVHFSTFADRADLRALGGAVRRVIDMLEHEAFRAIVDNAYIDDHGTGVDALTDDAAIDAWLIANVGDYAHAASSCRMGLVLDTRCAVRGYESLLVCDASSFSDIPAVNPHLAVVMLAESMVDKWLSW